MTITVKIYLKAFKISFINQNLLINLCTCAKEVFLRQGIKCGIRYNTVVILGIYICKLSNVLTEI